MESPSSPHNGNNSRVAETEPHLTMAGLFSRFLSELTTLLQKELALFKAELNEALSETKTALIAIAAGGAVLFGGALVLLAAIVLVLALVMPAWLAALIVGFVLVIAGYLMLQNGKRKLDPKTLKPQRTQEALRKDKELVQRRV